MPLVDRTQIRTYSLKDRKSKVNVRGFAQPHEVGASVRSFLDRLPRFLGAKDILLVAGAIVEARKKGKTVSLAMGGHVIKVGLAPIIIDLIRSGWITAIATNGAGMIHDFEIALVGHTSEDVAASLDEGAFGMAEETGRILNTLIREGVERGEGLGKAVGKGLLGMEAEHAQHSVMVAAFQANRPVTVHVAIGTDIHHMHPTADGAVLGEGTYRDFLEFCERVTTLRNGVHINLGSAVVLPEVFLKAVSLARNLGHSLHGLTTVNMDFIQHYRPLTNVVGRPTSLDGRGYAITGHHELLVPLLAAGIKEEAYRLGVEPRPSLLDNNSNIP